MILRTREDVEKLVSDAINLYGKNWKPNQLAEQVGKILDKENAIDLAKIKNYRHKGGIPQTLLTGAAIAYCALSDRSLVDSMTDEAALLSKAREIYDRLIGFSIGKVEYICKLLPPSKYPDRMDAEVTTYYRHPIVSPDFGSSILPIQVFTDVSSLDDVECDIETSGQGVPRTEDLKSKVLLNTQQERNSDGKIVTNSRAELIYKVKIDKRANANTYIKLSRKIIGAFRTKPNPGSIGIDLEHAGFRVNNPICSLSLTLEFPNEVISESASIPVRAVAWAPATLRVQEVDFLKISSQLTPNSPVPKGSGIWRWENTFPLMIGTGYALTYNVHDVQNQMQEVAHAGVQA